MRWYNNNNLTTPIQTYGNFLNIEQTETTTYIAKCVGVIPSANSNSFTVTSIPKPVIGVTSTTLHDAALAQIKVSTSCPEGVPTWYAYSQNPGQGSESTWFLNTGNDIILDEKPELSYSVKCVNSSTGCKETKNIDILNSISTLNITDLKLGVTSISIIQCGQGGNYSVYASPINGYDANTLFYTNAGGTSIASAYGNVLHRKNNVWEISSVIMNTSSCVTSNSALSRKYHTKYSFGTKNPPCSTTWIKDSDGSEVVLNLGPLCVNATSDMPPPPVVSTAGADICRTATVALTATPCPSASVVEWFLGNASTSFASGNSTINVTPFATTPSYVNSLQYRAICNTGGNNSVFSNNLVITSIPIGYPNNITRTPAGTVFTNAPIILTGSGCNLPNTYKWEDNSALNPRSITAVATAIYSFKCLNQGCESTDSQSITITVSPCPFTSVLSSLSSPTDDISSGIITKQAANAPGGKITATNKITGTANVTYQAKSIELYTGFRADMGVVFKAEVGGCL
jgi:hypothetical protein